MTNMINNWKYIYINNKCYDNRNRSNNEVTIY